MRLHGDRYLTGYCPAMQAIGAKRDDLEGVLHVYEADDMIVGPRFTYCILWGSAHFLVNIERLTTLSSNGGRGEN